jgi:TonB family protein
MKRNVIVVLLIMGFAANVSPRVLADTHGRCIAIYTPKPDYPALPNGEKPEGEGLFICRVDVRTGLVKSVSISKSTGHSILDKAAVDSFKRWKFQPGTCAPDVKIPLGFWHHLPPIDKAMAKP